MVDRLNLAPEIAFEDDWYAVQTIDERTFAIGEPLYHQQNWSYLIVGDACSLLFDTGSFCRDITGVVRRRTHGALTALPSHMHFDHLGNVTKFESVAVADLPMLRACATDGELTPTEDLFLGAYEGNSAPTIAVSRWIAIDTDIDLGGRRFRMLHTPGHSPDSISLYSRDENRLFSADFIYPGDLYGQVPGAYLPDYLDTATALCDLIDADTQVLCAHGNADVGDVHSAPQLRLGDVEMLRGSLEGIRMDAGDWPGQAQWRVEISPRLALIVSPEAVAAWR